MDVLHGTHGDFGDQRQTKLLERYGVTNDDFPHFRLFLKGNDPMNGGIKLTDDITVNVKNTLAKFVKSHGIYLVLKGCIMEFDLLAKEFMETNDKNNRNKIGENGKKLLDTLNENDKKSGEYYMKVMAKVVKDGNDYINKEMNRINGILNSGKIIKTKTEWFQKRYLLIYSFIFISK